MGGLAEPDARRRDDRVMLLLERPTRLTLGYLLGAYVTSITLVTP